MIIFEMNTMAFTVNMFFALASFAVAPCLCVTELKEIRILGLQAMTGDVYKGGPACLLGAQMALDDISHHPDVLNGFNLTYDYVDHEVGN